MNAYTSPQRYLLQKANIPANSCLHTNRHTSIWHYFPSTSHSSLDLCWDIVAEEEHRFVGRRHTSRCPVGLTVSHVEEQRVYRRPAVPEQAATVVLAFVD